MEKFEMDNKDKNRLVFNSDLELLSYDDGKTTPPRGVLSKVNGAFVADLKEVARRVRISANAGANGMSVMLYAPWHSKTLDECLFPFVRVGDKFDLTEFNPEWDAVFTSVLEKIFETVPQNYMVEIVLLDNCQLNAHDGWVSPNPYNWNGKTMNINGTGGRGYRHFYAVPLPILCKFIDHVYALVKKWIDRIRWKVGNELPVVFDGMVQVPTPLGTVTVPKSVKLVYDLGRYLYDKKKIPANMLAWGGTLGTVVWREATVDGQTGMRFVIEYKDKDGNLIDANNVMTDSMHVQIDRIANRIDPKFAAAVLVEIHGVSGDYEVLGSPQPSFYACVGVDFYGETHTRKAEYSDDGVDYKNRPEYASKVDRQKTYWRASFEVRYTVYLYVFEHNKAGRLFKVEVLPQTWEKDYGIEGMLAAAKAYKKAYGVALYNAGKYPEPVIVDPVIPDPVTPDVPDVPDVVVKPPFSLQGEWNNNKGKILVAIGIIVILLLIAIF
jgi:hypothetical protein